MEEKKGLTKKLQIQKIFVVESQNKIFFLNFQFVPVVNKPSADVDFGTEIFQMR